MPIQPPQAAGANCVCTPTDPVNNTPQPSVQPSANSNTPGPSAPAASPATPLMLQPVDENAVQELCKALSLSDDARGQTLGKMLYQLGYRQVEHWKINSAALTVGPDENGVSIPVVRNPETQCVVIPHEYPEAGKFWLQLKKEMVQKFSGRFNWNREMYNNTPEGCIILRLGAEPYHLAEEHFHHVFSRANLIRLQKHHFVTERMLPRVGDTEAYAATMAYRLMNSSPDYKKWAWGGHEDIALGLQYHTNPELLKVALWSDIDLEPVSYPSLGKNDGRTTRAARSMSKLNKNEFAAVGIDRFDSTVALSWFDLRDANIPWTTADMALTGLSATQLKHLTQDDD